MERLMTPADLTKKVMPSTLEGIAESFEAMPARQRLSGKQVAKLLRRVAAGVPDADLAGSG